MAAAQDSEMRDTNCRERIQRVPVAIVVVHLSEFCLSARHSELLSNVIYDALKSRSAVCGGEMKVVFMAGNLKWLT